MFCCATCFGDRGLKREIIPIHSDKVGSCSYCQSANENLVSPDKLKNYFELLINIYRPDDESGKTLVEWLKEDWGIFSHPSMDLAHAKELLADILDDGQIVRERFCPSDLCISDRLDAWAKLKEELMYKNRFFPRSKMDSDRIEELLPYLLLDNEEILTTWYRSRIQRTEKMYPLEQMGAPPKRFATQGRANPAGIPYLYLASTPETAVSEIRPHTGEFASVAKFSITDHLKIVDLRNPKYSISPFLLSDESEIALLRADLEFLINLGNELTRPVLPHSAAIDYIPSQYLCEFIKNFGYHGVQYRSSVSDGVNLALFDPEKAKTESVARFKIARVMVDVAKDN